MSDGDGAPKAGNQAPRASQYTEGRVVRSVLRKGLGLSSRLGPAFFWFTYFRRKTWLQGRVRVRTENWEKTLLLRWEKGFRSSSQSWFSVLVLALGQGPNTVAVALRTGALLGHFGVVGTLILMPAT